MWRNICNIHKVKLSDERLLSYVKNYDITPALFNSAVLAAKRTKQPDAIDRTLKGYHKAMTRKEHIEKVNEKDIRFDFRLVNADIDLNNLTDRIVSANKNKFSLCLFGVPGTGKSFFARHLAEKLNLEVEHKRASDIESKWVGETEQNIANAFSDAKNNKKLLIFDEADSFLRSREFAQRSWEISSVNEMLTQMEHHPYPFICTTNLKQEIDGAALRRFTFKVNYGFMKLEQVCLGFKIFFDVNVNIDDINYLTKLTPGDFAVVKNKLDFLGKQPVEELIKMLGEEQSVKGYKANKIGFTK